MKNKPNSIQVFEVRLWSKQHFIKKGVIEKPKGAYENNIYDGLVTNKETKKQYFFKTPAQFLKAIEECYKTNELKKSKRDGKNKH